MKLLRKENHAKLIQRLMDGRQVYGPVKQGERVGFRRLGSVEELHLDAQITDMSVKSFMFPRVEKLFSFNKTQTEVEIQEIDLDKIPHKIVLGVRPCDASGASSLAAIFEWDPVDPIFERRKERTTIVSYACTTADNYCFCTSLGGSPGNTAGSDMQLTRTDAGDYLVEVLTPKGEAVIAVAPELFEDAPADVSKEKYLAQVSAQFNMEALKNNVNKAFDTTLFDEYAVRCLGCGTCAYVCPTCACFDIQDETKGAQGIRYRSWDSCGHKLFTLHTSGHNPRETQGARWRQRLMHKFSYMPERLEILGCVGCGRCSRRCPVDMNLAEGLKSIADAQL